MIQNKYDILAPDGVTKRYSGILDANCIRKFSLMSEDSVTLCFSLRDAIDFSVGSSAGDFFIAKEQVGTWNANTGVWDYKLKFDAYYWLWANKILRYIIPGVDSAKETSFSLTATIDVHAAVIKNCLDFLGLKYDGSPFRIDTTDTSLSLEAKLVKYENLSVLGGIQAIAEAFECEWWVDGNAVYFGRCENKSTDFTFEAGVNVSSISFSQGKTEAPNRLYVYGSDRNLPTNYRETTGNDTIGGVVNKRLMLPEGIPYLQTDPNLPESQIVEKVIILDGVYPKTDLTVTEDPEIYTSEADNGDGSTTTGTFYRLKYGNDFRFSNTYILPNEELHIIFQSGLLNGMDFGAKFNPKGLNEKNTNGTWNPDAQMIEVVANEDYGRMLPDTVLKPQKGDKFILYGWDSTKMADLGLVDAAESELLEEGTKALAEYTKDLSTCTCPMAWDYMKPLMAENRQPKPGDAVTIIDTAHFGKGGRKSRIIGYEYKLDKPYAECTYTCGENISVSRLKSIESKLEGLSKSGTKVQIQNILDFLSKRYADRTPYLLSSDEGFEVGRFLAGVSGGQFAIDKETGHSFAELDKLYVRVRAYFESLTVIEREALAGEQQTTPGSGVVCTSVEEVKDSDGNIIGWRCYFLSEQDGEKRETKIIAGDQAIAQTFNATTGTANKVFNKRWWRLVTAVSNDAYTDDSGNHYGYIEVSKDDCESGSDIPEAGDEIVQLGNRNDATRQTAIIISTVSADAPSMKLFTGIGSGTTNAEHYSLDDRDIISYGYDHALGRAYMRCYGDLWLGDKNGTSYVKYDAGAKKWLFHNVSISVTSTIGDKTFEEYIKEIAPSASQEDIEKYVKAIVDPKIEGIQNQIDGVIETWFYNGVPTLDNYPASGWTATADKEKHLGDLYFDNETGLAYRFSKDESGNYFWNDKVDSATAKALAEAAKAYNLAEKKHRTFTSQPIPPYEVGDIWVNATYAPDYANDLLRCVKSKADGQTFGISDWTLASKYTDDTLAQEAKDDASAAKTAADNAQKDAKDAKDRLDSWASDGVISPTEKQGIKDEIARITGDKNDIIAQYVKYGGNVPKAYTDAHAAYLSALTALSASTPENITIPSDFATNQTTYYTQRTVCLGEIAGLAKTYADKVAEASVEDFQYLRKALENTTDITGGLMYTTLLQLGYKDGEIRHILAGMNGAYIPALGGRTVAAWFGGKMVDLFDKDGNRVNPVPADHAKSLFRMDGTGYLADGLIGWNTDGSGWLAGDNITWDAQGYMKFGSGIKINLADGSEAGLVSTLESTLNILNGLINYLYPTKKGVKCAWTDAGIDGIQSAVGFSALGDVAALGSAGDGSGAVGGASLLSELNDVLLTDVKSGQALVYNGSHWVNQPIDTGLDVNALADYLTDNNYAKKSDIPTLYALTIQKNGTTVDTYMPNSKATIINIADVASAATLSGHIGNTTMHITADERAKWDKTTADLINYVRKSGDVMTGVLHLPGGKFTDTANTGALDLQNSDIYGVNAIKFADLAQGADEGLQWYRDATHIDSFWVNNGVMYFTPNREWGKVATNYTVLHTGNYASALDGHYVTLNTEQSLSVRKHFRGGTGIHMTRDDSNYENFAFRNKDASVLLGYIGYHNVANAMFISAKGDNVDSWVDTVGKYQLRLSKDGAFTWNTYPILHTNNYASYLNNTYVTLGTAQTITGQKTFANGCLVLKGQTSPSMDWGHISQAPHLRFNNIDSSQNVALVMSDYDSYRTPAGLKLIGNQSNEWFEAPRLIATTSVQIGSCVLSWDSSAKALKVSTNVYADGDVAAKGAPSGGGSAGGGSAFGLLRSWPASAPSASTTDALGANLGWELYQNKADKSQLAGYLPLSGGTITGDLYIKGGILTNHVSALDGNGLLTYHPTSWTGVSNAQWAVGTVNSQGVIRSSNASLIHYRNGAGSYTIWDSGNDGSGSGLDADLLDGVHNGDVTARALKLLQYTSSTSDMSNLAIIKQHYTEFPAGQPCALGLSHGSLSMAFGWRLGGSYNSVDKAYCGWFISDYGTPRWIGADNGSWKSHTFAFTSDLTWGNVAGKPTTLAGYGITDAMQFQVASNYVGANFANSSLSQKAHDTYIELWDSPGWWNLMAGKFMIAGGTASQVLMANGSVQPHYKAANVTSATSDNGMITPLAMNQWTAKTYVKKAGDTMSGRLIISGSETIPIVFSVTNNVSELGLRMAIAGTAKGWVGYSSTHGANLYNYACAKYLGIKDNGTPHFHGNTLWHSGNDGSGSGLDADLLDGHQASWFYSQYVIDASGLNQNTYYPVTINMGADKEVRIEVWVGLNSGTKPSWSTHTQGFSVAKVWTTNGSGWGSIPVIRRILQSTYSFANSDPVLGVGQLTNSSNEYFYVRGGGKYFVKTNRNTVPYLQTSTFTMNNQSISPTTTAPAPFNVGDGIVAGAATKLQTARTIWGQSFNGTANVSGNMTGVGTIRCQGTASSYCEGIRIKPYANWSIIVLGGNDLTADSGTSANSWGVFNNNGDFYINKNSSYVQQAPRLWGHNNGWTVGNSSTSAYALNAASFICDSWIRSKGQTGWYNESYAGGWYMADGTWIRNYNNKALYMNTAEVRTDLYFNRRGYSGSSWNNGYGAYNVEIANNSSQTPLMVAYRAGQSPSVTGANRLFAMEMLNSGGEIRFTTIRSGSIIAALRILSAGDIVVYGVTGCYRLNVTENVNAQGDVVAKGTSSSSDARLKDIIGDLHLDPRTIAAAPLVQFTWKDNGRKDFGGIAQYWQPIIPEAIRKDARGYLSMSYGKLGYAAGVTNAREIIRIDKSLLTVSHKQTEHERRIAELERENRELKLKVKQLESKAYATR